MSQLRSKRMMIVLQLAEQAEQDAAEKLQQNRDVLKSAQDQLVQLQDYQQEYLSQINSKSHQTAREMISDRAFVGQLEEAAVTQRQRLAVIHRQCDGAMEVWQKAYQKRNSIQELIEKIKLTESEEADKKLQKELDELSSLAFQRRS